MLGRLLLGGLVWSLSGCAGALLLPPSRTDLGAVAATDTATGAGARIAAGVHYASLTRRHDVRWDVGMGAIHEREAQPYGSRENLPVAEAKKVKPRYRSGTYVEVSRAIESKRHRRSWFGVRGEALVPPSALREPSSDALVYALLARLSTELYATGAGAGAEGGSNAAVIGGYYGTFAVGLYAEAGVRGQLGGVPAFIATSGVSLRLPFIAGVGIAGR